MNDMLPTLQQLGWKPFFQQQLSLDELSDFHIGRIVEQHRSRIIALSEQGQKILIVTPSTEKICVGDWVLFDDDLKIVRLLERQALFQRKSPGSKLNTQLIASNIDTVMIVSSLNQDFSLSRIERYLAIAKEAQVDPVIVLTKADLCDDADDRRMQVQKLNSSLSVYALSALAPDDVEQLNLYCRSGQTLAFLGSSGVGKSTLVNSLLGSDEQKTSEIRDDDSKGRHTTTHRALKLLAKGGLLIDTPGMRELQLTDCEQGVNETFAEILELTKQCRFHDCQHVAEPGCAVLAAFDAGVIDARRLTNYQKLLREQAFNNASLREKHSKEKALGKLIHNTQVASRQAKKGY